MQMQLVSLEELYFLMRCALTPTVPYKFEDVSLELPSCEALLICLRSLAPTTKRPDISVGFFLPLFFTSIAS